jgi:hypothetical protein
MFNLSLYFVGLLIWHLLFLSLEQGYSLLVIGIFPAELMMLWQFCLG